MVILICLFCCKGSIKSASSSRIFLLDKNKAAYIVAFRYNKQKTRTLALVPLRALISASNKYRTGWTWRLHHVSLSLSVYVHACSHARVCKPAELIRICLCDFHKGILDCPSTYRLQNLKSIRPSLPPCATV